MLVKVDQQKLEKVSGKKEQRNVWIGKDEKNKRKKEISKRLINIYNM